MVNIVVLWNTRSMDATLRQLQTQGVATEAADIARLSPLLNQHIHMLGRYRFVEDVAVLHGELRPFADRNPPATGRTAEE